MMYDGDIAFLLPVKNNGYFLQALLGPVNVRATRKDSRYKVKEEYNAYRVNFKALTSHFVKCLLIRFC
jgi:hypothetical protein